MYEEYFRFTQPPFSIAPDPNFLYLSDGHSEALAHLMYGFSHGGFVLITGEVGTGKTTLLRNLVKQTPADLDVAFILNPRLTVKELLETLCDELGIAYPEAGHPTVKQYIDVLNKQLLETYRAGRSTVVIIDEAQNLSPAVLEQIRLLTNLETDETKLLRIILLGQPELGALLERSELRQLAQRITARYHLGPLSREDCYAYVVHRLSKAGGDPLLFPRPALALLYRLSRGIPRILNTIADRALLGTYVEGRHRVTRRIIRRAAQEVLGKPSPYRRWAVAGGASLCAAGLAWAYLALPGADDGAAPPAAPSATQGQVSRIAEPTAAPPQTATEAAAPRLAPSTTAAAGSMAAETAPAAVTEENRAPAPTPPSTAAATAPVEPPPLLGRPPNMDGPATQRAAYIAAFAAWGADFTGAAGNMIPCNFAPTAGLQCLGMRGNWSDVEHLNLPVVLELWDEQPYPFYAAVLGLKDGALQLQYGAERMTTTPRALGELWHGQFVLLWQTPPDYRGALKQGDVHATVGWLRQQLAPLVSTPIDSASPNRFDAGLDGAVREFQTGEGLATDGIVGPATWIRLANRLALPAPKLDS